MRKKISILGAGKVGATIAYTLVSHGLASEIVLIDIDRDKAKGEAMDIIQGSVLHIPTHIYAGTYENAKDSDLVIVTMGLARRPNQTRLDLAQANVNITKDVIPKIYKYAKNALYIVVSNPVDIITYTLIKGCGIPKKQVIGTGTLLDTARLRASIAHRAHLNGRNIHAYVLGEHGDSSVIPWSITTIAGHSLTSYMQKYKDIVEYSEKDLLDIEYDVRTSGTNIINFKGATFYAISLAVKSLCQGIFMDNYTVATVTSLIEGPYGIYDVCLSMPTVIGSKGIIQHIAPPINEEETRLLLESATKLKETIASLDI